MGQSERSADSSPSGGAVYLEKLEDRYERVEQTLNEVVELDSVTSAEVPSQPLQLDHYLTGYRALMSELGMEGEARYTADVSSRVDALGVGTLDELLKRAGGDDKARKVLTHVLRRLPVKELAGESTVSGLLRKKALELIPGFEKETGERLAGLRELAVSLRKQMESASPAHRESLRGQLDLALSSISETEEKLAGLSTRRTEMQLVEDLDNYDSRTLSLLNEERVAAVGFSRLLGGATSGSGLAKVDEFLSQREAALERFEKHRQAARKFAETDDGVGFRKRVSQLSQIMGELEVNLLGYRRERQLASEILQLNQNVMSLKANRVGGSPQGGTGDFNISYLMSGEAQKQATLEVELASGMIPSLHSSNLDRQQFRALKAQAEMEL